MMKRLEMSKKVLSSTFALLFSLVLGEMSGDFMPKSIDKAAESIRHWQQKIIETWTTDAYEARCIATNVVTVIKRQVNTTMRQHMATEYADFVLRLDVTNGNHAVKAASWRNFMVQDVIALLDDSDEEVFIKWGLKLDYCRRLATEIEWLECAAGTNWMGRDFTMTNGAAVVSSPDFVKRFGRPVVMDGTRCPGYHDPNDYPEYRRRSKARMQKSLARYLLGMLNEEERECNGEMFKRDCDRLSNVRRQELLGRKERVFGAVPKPGAAGSTQHTK